jgi:hypothetical protein
MVPVTLPVLLTVLYISFGRKSIENFYPVFIFRPLHLIIRNQCKDCVQPLQIEFEISEAINNMLFAEPHRRPTPVISVAHHSNGITQSTFLLTHRREKEHRGGRKHNSLGSHGVEEVGSQVQGLIEGEIDARPKLPLWYK